MNHKLNSTLTVIAALVLGSAGLLHSAPLIEFNFNSNSSPVTSSGTTAGVTGIVSPATFAPGVSGLAGDYAFDNSASTGMGSLGTGGSVSGNSVFPSLSSFTLQGWFKSGTAIAGAARLFDDYTNLGSTGFGLRADTTTGNLVLTIRGVNGGSTGAAYGTTNAWVFFAVSYDFADENARFYVGASSTSVSLVNTAPMDVFGTGPTLLGTSNLVIGNVVGANTRPYDGLLDNMRLFGAATGSTGALSLSELETLRANDIANVPEPATWTLLALFISLMLGIRQANQSRRPRPPHYN